MATADASLFDRDMAQLAQRNPGRAWLALAVVAAVALTGVAAWRQGWFTPTVDLYIELPGAMGVQVGTPVKLKGFKIGEVHDLELSPELNVKAHLQIEARRLPLLSADAHARFGREGPIGGKFVDVVPGLRGGPALAEGQTLPMETGSELDDVMATVKVALEKLAQAISKVDPILDDTKKLTAEASSASGSVRQSMGAMLANMEAISKQLKTVSETTSRLMANADHNRSVLAADAQKTLQSATEAVQSANTVIQTVQRELPQILNKVQASATDVNVITGDAKRLASEAREQLPPALRAGRALTEDAADLTSGARRTWPFTSIFDPPIEPHLPLDGFEGKKP